MKWSPPIRWLKSRKKFSARRKKKEDKLEEHTIARVPIAGMGGASNLVFRVAHHFDLIETVVSIQKKLANVVVVATKKKAVVKKKVSNATIIIDQTAILKKTPRHKNSHTDTLNRTKAKRN